MGVKEISTVAAAEAAENSPLVGLALDHFTQSQLMEKALELVPKAHAGDGAAGIKLQDYPNHFTMLTVRHKDGGAEIHEHNADIFLVVQGTATLVTGGTVQEIETVGLGEIRGKAVLNGKSTILKQGDFAHIPARLPHQLLVAEGESFTYFVIKVKES